MQLSKVSITDTKVFEFKDPYTLESFDKPIFVTINAVKSKEGKKAEHAMRLAIVTAMQDESNLVIDGETHNLKPELIREISFAMLADLIVSWKGIEDENGKAIKFSKDEAIKAFNECEEFADALYMFANDVGNFRKV